MYTHLPLPGVAALSTHLASIEHAAVSSGKGTVDLDQRDREELVRCFQASKLKAERERESEAAQSAERERQRLLENHGRKGF